MIEIDVRSIDEVMDAVKTLLNEKVNASPYKNPVYYITDNGYHDGIEILIDFKENNQCHDQE